LPCYAKNTYSKLRVLFVSFLTNNKVSKAGDTMLMSSQKAEKPWSILQRLQVYTYATVCKCIPMLQYASVYLCYSMQMYILCYSIQGRTQSMCCASLVPCLGHSISQLKSLYMSVSVTNCDSNVKFPYQLYADGACPACKDLG